MLTDDSTTDETIALVYQAATETVSWSLALESIRATIAADCVRVIVVDRHLNEHAASHSSEGQADPTAMIRAIECALHCSRSTPSASHRHACSFLAAAPQCEGFNLYENNSIAFLFLVQGSSVFASHGRSHHALHVICHHLASALRMSRIRSQQGQCSAVTRHLLNRRRGPAYLIDADRRVVMANDAVTMGSSISSLLRINQKGLLECTFHEHDQRLSEALKKMSSLSESGAMAVSQQPYRSIARVKSPNTNCDRVLYFEQVAPDPESVNIEDSPMLMVSEHSMNINAPLDPHLLSVLFNLTHAEAAVAAAVASGNSLKQIAMHKRTSINTVASQVKAIYSKLGVRKSTELAALLHSAPLLTGGNYARSSPAATNTLDEGKKP